MVLGLLEPVWVDRDERTASHPRCSQGKTPCLSQDPTRADYIALDSSISTMENEIQSGASFNVLLLAYSLRRQRSHNQTLLWRWGEPWTYFRTHPFARYWERRERTSLAMVPSFIIVCRNSFPLPRWSSTALVCFDTLTAPSRTSWRVSGDWFKTY